MALWKSSFIRLIIFVNELGKLFKNSNKDDAGGRCWPTIRCWAPVISWLTLSLVTFLRNYMIVISNKIKFIHYNNISLRLSLKHVIRLEIVYKIKIGCSCFNQNLIKAWIEFLANFFISLTRRFARHEILVFLFPVFCRLAIRVKPMHFPLSIGEFVRAKRKTEHCNVIGQRKNSPRKSWISTTFLYFFTVRANKFA